LGAVSLTVAILMQEPRVSNVIAGARRRKGRAPMAQV
jgi:hypothetical protein